MIIIILIKLISISIHAPTRGATIKRVTLIVIILFQSTLPREERHYSWSKSQITNDFNPRSHERSDNERRTQSSKRWNFNPRSHERSDPAHSGSPLNSRIISIHAPTRGATILLQPYFRLLSVFQSTLPREERPSSDNFIVC